MVIANPIYDVVFKKLMENERVAKFFIGTLLNQTVESLEMKPQEFTYTDKTDVLTVFRLDFIAIVKTEAGEMKKVLIEIQKARKHIDLMRFRNYLAEQYKKEELVDDEKQALPITTIYILGFDLPEIDTACIHVERQYKDLIKSKTIQQKSDFIEKLTHDSYVIQVKRIKPNYKSKLDELLSVFEQSNFLNDAETIKEYSHEAKVEEVKVITDILHHSGTDPESRKDIDNEREAWRTINVPLEAVEKEHRKAIKKKDEVISEKDKIIQDLMKRLKESENDL